MISNAAIAPAPSGRQISWLGLENAEYVRALSLRLITKRTACSLILILLLIELYRSFSLVRP